MATAFTNNPDSSELLRFPLTYRSYFLIRLAYGFFDPGQRARKRRPVWSSDRHQHRPPRAVSLGAAGAADLRALQPRPDADGLCLARTLAGTAPHARNHGRAFYPGHAELSIDRTGHRTSRKRPHPEFSRASADYGAGSGLLPPGLAANAIAQVSHAQYALGLLSLFVLAALTAGIGLLLHLRLRAQFRGENLSEAAARPTVEQVQGLQVGWNLPGFSQSVAAVFEKEVRYLSRSGPMLLTLIMPIFMLMIFRLGPMNPMRQSSGFNRTPDMAFPGAAAYAILVLTNLVFNSFGGDAAGMQFFFASPVTFRQIVLAKNLTHASILAGQYRIRLDRRHLSLRHSAPRGFDRNVGWTALRRASELHGR